MTANTTQPDTTADAQPKEIATPAAILKTVRGQRYIAPPGRHSQQSHRRAQARAAAQGNATIEEHHAQDRSMVKTELSRLAALKVTQKPNPPK
jgi:hypothetical protein